MGVKPLTKSQVRKEKRMKKKYGKSYIPRHDRMLTELKRLVNDVFPLENMEPENRASRHFWNSHINDIDEELHAPEYNVVRIAGDRWVSVGNQQTAIEFDLRYEGFEEEPNWQPYENVCHLQLLKDYIATKYEIQIE